MIRSLLLLALFSTISIAAFAQTSQRHEGDIKFVPPVIDTSSVPEETLTPVDVPPRFVGNLNDWIIDNLKYPSSERRKNHEGRVLVKFIVDEHGEVTKARVVKSSGYPVLDAEALRIVSSMPRWEPGRQNGKVVKVYFTLPIKFKLI